VSRPLELVRPDRSRRARLADDAAVVYIARDRPDRYRLGDAETGREIDSDELLDRIFAADLVVTW
jgi:hypothetical protein